MQFSSFRQQQIILRLFLLTWCAFVPIATVAQKQPAKGDINEIMRLSEQAGRLYEAGRYEESLPLARSLLGLCEKALGANHPDTAEALRNLALLYKVKGDYAQAEPLMKRALAINEKVLGADHPDTAASLDNLAGLYQTKGELASSLLPCSCLWAE